MASLKPLRLVLWLGGAQSPVTVSDQSARHFDLPQSINTVHNLQHVHGQAYHSTKTTYISCFPPKPFPFLPQSTPTIPPSPLVQLPAQPAAARFLFIPEAGAARRPFIPAAATLHLTPSLRPPSGRAVLRPTPHESSARLCKVLTTCSHLLRCWKPARHW
ncbi:hypothetical protein MKEN_01157300 [Mycena kentingensis (nom. inval.)]|nr:hypothetical protein MKEN_01157300 [Mycena kentingensis (nom. inval.)]